MPSCLRSRSFLWASRFIEFSLANGFWKGEGEREREKKGAKSGRAASRWRHDDRRRLLAGFVAIIQLVKVSGRVTAHKTNMIAAANCCEPRGSNKGEGGRRAKGLVLSGTDEVITG